MLQKLIAPLALLINKSLLTLFMLISFIVVNSQITINTPNLGFSQVCASPTFNTYNLSFTFSPVVNVGSGNIFTVELSNATGSFASPVVLTTTTVSTSPANVSFAFPTNVNGTGYRIRVKSSNPATISPSSSSFSANYAVYNQPFTINNNNSTQAVCSSSNFNLTIDSGTNSPLNFSQLTYRWYRNNTIIPGQTSSSLPISQQGNYYVEVNYGSCNLNAYSNVVTISITQSEVLTINSQGNATIFCPTSSLLLTSMIAGSGYTYQWYKNGVLISGAANSTYSATEEGSYYLVASNTVCDINSNVLVLSESTFTLSLDSGVEINLLPGQTRTVSCTTNASNPSYIWYKDNIEIIGQTLSSLSINQTGVYKVKVKQNTGCIIEKEVSSLVTAPSAYNLVINHSNGYADCVNLSETLSIGSFFATASLGTIPIPSTIGVTYKWFKNNVEIAGAVSNSYTIINAVENGTYKVEAIFTNNQIVSSNNLEVKLTFNETINLSSDGILCNTTPTVTISSSVTNPIYAYQWFKEGTSTVLGTNSTYEATEVGNYFLTLSYAGCQLSSNLIEVETIDETILVTNYDDNEEITIEEGDEVTISANGADSYTWYLDGVLISSIDEVIVNSEGEIELIALSNGCEIIRTFNVSFEPKTFNVVIPNTISPNNDGINDTWIITEELAYKNDIEIIIFSSNQVEVLRTKNYQNNWPLEQINNKNKIYYYKILKDNSVIFKGTISVIQ